MRKYHRNFSEPSGFLLTPIHMVNHTLDEAKKIYAGNWIELSCIVLTVNVMGYF